MKHAVLGAGAIGGLMATALGAIGEDVTVLVRPEKVAHYPRQLVLQQPERTITAPARPASRLNEPVDVLWISTKAYDLEPALASVAAEAKLVVPLLNGTEHVAVLRTRFGEEHVVPGTIAVEAERLSEGRFAQRSIVRLNLAAAAEPMLGPVLARLQEQLGFICHFFDSEPKLLWTKLTFLAPFALVTSASGKTRGEIFADPEWKSKLFTAIEEAAAVARASGAEIDVAKAQGGFDALPATMRSSMAKDLVAGRRLELDSIAGPIVRGGAQHGLAVPVTRELVTIIEAKAGGTQA